MSDQADKKVRDGSAPDVWCGPLTVSTSDQADKCPRCDSPAPHLHPQMQFEGEVQECSHSFHLRETPQNLCFADKAAEARERDSLIATAEALNKLQREALDHQGAEIKRLKTMSTVEMMCENPNVDAHVREWETRCLKAEAELDRLKAENAARLEALETIAKWEFNFRGDCVADARRIAQREIYKAKGEKS